MIFISILIVNLFGLEFALFSTLFQQFDQFYSNILMEI